MVSPGLFRSGLAVLALVLIASALPATARGADDSLVIATGERALPLTAQVTTTDRTFKQYLYSFPLETPMLLAGLSGSITIVSQGRGFAEALVSVDHLPADELCPVNGEVFDSYAEIRARHPGLQALAKFIVKEPLGSAVTTIPTDLQLPRPIPVKRCLVLILDGAVLRVGGPFTMSSQIVAHLGSDFSTAASGNQTTGALALGTVDRPIESLAFDDEFCFDRESGCDLATPQRTPNWAFRKVTKLRHPGRLLALYGNVSDSAFGWDGAHASQAAWTVQNAYYLYPKCGLAEGPTGPDDFFAQIPPDATMLLSFELKGQGQAALHRPLYRAFDGLAFAAGDCLVHLVRLSAESPLGGIDTESQVRAQIEQNGSP